jgi:hypothetical protein
MASLTKHRNGMTLIQIVNMNERIKELMKQADYPAPELALRAHKLAELIVRECASKVDWILTEGGKTQGDLIREHFGISVSDIETAESYHSDKGYSLGEPEAQEAFESKRGYKL